MRSITETSDWHRYLAALAELRLTVKRNEDDYVFEKDRRGRIVYLFDSDVVRFFMNPLESRSLLTGFGLSADSEHLAAASIMTAEYLFSRDLAGQGDTPSYLAPWHAEEVNAVLEGLKHRVAQSGDKDRTIGGATYEARQFSRLLEDDLIRPLHLLPEAGGAILKPDRRIVDMWYAQLNEVKGDSAGRFSRKSAASIAQLTLLNQQSKHTVQASRYVLVTTDRYMLNAYARWYYRTGSKADFVLRHALQYSPILNAEQMSGGRVRSESIQQMGEAIDSLFAVYADGSKSYWQHLAGVAYGDSTLSKIPSSLASKESMSFLRLLDDTWTKAGRSAVALNSHWLRRHYDRVEMSHPERLKAGMGATKDKLLKSFERSLVDVETFHAKFVASGLLPPPRTILPKTASPEPLFMRTRRRALKDVIDADALNLGDLGGVPKANTRPWILLARAACIAFRLGHWQPAAQWAQRSLSVSKVETSSEHMITELEIHELHYLIASAAKQHPKLVEYPTLQSQLQHSLAFYNEVGDTFGQVRTFHERSELAASVFLEEDEKNRLLDPGLTAIFLDAVDDAVGAIQLASAKDMAGPRWLVLRRKVDASVLAIDVLEGLLFGTKSVPPDLVASARQNLSGLENPTSLEGFLERLADPGRRATAAGEAPLVQQAKELAGVVRSEVDRSRLLSIAWALGREGHG